MCHAAKYIPKRINFVWKKQYYSAKIRLNPDNPNRCLPPEQSMSRIDSARVEEEVEVGCVRSLGSWTCEGQISMRVNGSNVSKGRGSFLCILRRCRSSKDSVWSLPGGSHLGKMFRHHKTDKVVMDKGYKDIWHIPMRNQFQITWPGINSEGVVCVKNWKRDKPAKSC